MHIRAATTKDIPLLCDLYTKFYCYNASLQPKYCIAVIETGEYIKWIMEQPDHTLFLAEYENSIGGFIHLAIAETPNYPSVAAHTFGQIVDLFVLEKYRGKGIGKQLVSAAKRWQTSKSLAYLELEVLANNPQAIKFYQKMGLTASRLTLNS
ncbi:GNAT family N-acetyltransferase [Candidatus Enterococcus ferrettii]|uniref:N-acetyltransferase domain-containing protein n=1 Tax=Candidatus Enterococcus ferrettii TaxID=2815324 RepID=A0ABV0EZG8_9ENTE|nr:GNAT family N-acetyltransferase [Enterococcus sp. 665A]MBO1343066.1 GNAT family N-acetyltransferase [Enterococcus sp. 665A]